ncbi:hypothetical protein B0H15DRAFT_866016 [Mycena belliarum]|uniref:Fumarylacetoacetase-like C-terminal domain-containing protein n=1 Tax=Mycena belliarum TaxID=1033014 RepID=A0AAD6TTX9_9AGAR|nr:hypothetical protein B0H15DRAFT_866016 [Mycena belliae]
MWKYSRRFPDGTSCRPQLHVAWNSFLSRCHRCVGKNYIAHAAEFHKSGFDSSDKNEQPDFPVLFTKRATSIIPTGKPIYTHPNVTSSPDYEGELGIVIGKAGLAVPKEDAWAHVWGAVIINDVTARERQRDHKQFYIGKSLDTFCPMGPYVVPSSSLAFEALHLTTKVNGQVRQSQNTSELIFDVPTLIATASMGISIQPGDIIATGTPVGVGMGMSPCRKNPKMVGTDRAGLAAWTRL